MEIIAAITEKSIFANIFVNMHKEMYQLGDVTQVFRGKDSVEAIKKKVIIYIHYIHIIKYAISE